MAYTKNNSSPSWLRKNEILKYFSHTKTNNYAEFVSEGIDADVEKFYQKNTKSILGGREFINEKLTTLTNNQKIYCQPAINRFNQPVPIDLIISVIKEYFNVDINHLLNSQAGVKNLPRLFAIAMTKQYGQLTHQKIAENFHPIKANSISTMMDRFEIYLENDEGARRDQQNICNLLRVLSGVT